MKTQATFALRNLLRKIALHPGEWTPQDDETVGMIVQGIVDAADEEIGAGNEARRAAEEAVEVHEADYHGRSGR